ncbi:MAG: 16S rRNA (uracil(1498)-N(3))-methyltransferase [Bacteroidales bacterium]|nr:16S rRNA (uracil(1498)-N(3))-methyltransferase [Bacteroidales bacterium]
MQFFYQPDLSADMVTLSPEESKHCVKVLRKSCGDAIFLTDGKGTMVKAELVVADMDNCTAQIVERYENYGQRKGWFHLAVAPTKNPGRMEWLVEKAIEIGVEQISFIICDHSERERIDLKRLERIAVSALKQSNTAWLPEMNIVSFDDLLTQYASCECDKLMAWCDENNQSQLADIQFSTKSILLLIGPEGDFSPREIAMARQQQFKEVKLGDRRLRTETAALYGCCLVAAKLVGTEN